jgi:erythromycin esterase-like protein
MMKSPALGVAILLVLVIGSSAHLHAQESKEIEWLSNNAFEFETAEPGHGFEDLEPLRDMIGDARIVGLGECTHGTKEFFQMKHRIVEFLASEMGFTIFSIEANMPEAYRVDDYVSKGEGDPEELISGMYFWTWSTLEVLDMVEWMRQFNASGRGRIQFTGFDMQKPDVAMEIVQSFLEDVDPDRAHAVAFTFKRMKSPPGVFCTLTQSFPAAAARGKRLRFSGFIKTENLENGRAALWGRADGPDGHTLVIDNMHGRSPSGTTDWKEYEIGLDVPEEAVGIVLGFMHTGQGRAWFDDLQVELDGEEYVDSAAFNSGFETDSIRTLWETWAGTYDAELDTENNHTSEHSLKIEYIGHGGYNTVAASGLAQMSSRLLASMQGSRERYLESRPAEQVDWAIQNARIIDQCMRSRLPSPGNLVRDESMAANIDWILEQNPGAKIIVWAHNGHIARENGLMGYHLARLYGDEYVPIGFTTSRGECTTTGARGLDTADLQSPPPGSIESVFAATGKPRLFVDLRAARRGSEESGWLRELRPYRSIGAKVLNRQFRPLLASHWFDVLIYFDTSSPSTVFQRSRKPVN